MFSHRQYEDVMFRETREKIKYFDFVFQITDELLAYAGKDLSHHFTIDNKPRTRFTIHGTTIPTLAATTLTTRYPTIYDYALDSSLPKIINSSWWDSKDYEIGVITATERPLRIINTLTSNIDLI